MKRILFASMSIIMIIGAGGCGNSKRTEAASESSTIDLYQYRTYEEDDVINTFGFVKNDSGMYPPSSENSIFYCNDGVVTNVILDESSVGKYTFLGVSVGDKMSDMKANIEKCYTYDSGNAYEEYFHDFYIDNETGKALFIYYSMTSDEIVGLVYDATYEMEPEDRENQEEPAEEEPAEPVSESLPIIDTQEYTCWDEYEETLIVLNFFTEEKGTMEVRLTYTDGSTDSRIGNFEYDEEAREYYLYHDGIYSGTYFRLYESEGLDYMDLFNEGDIEYLTLIDKEYAYSNVG